MNLRRLQRHWNRLAQSDPMWAVLTEFDSKGIAGGVEEFFATGRAEIEDVMRELDGLGAHVPRGSALDFGCGVGRVTIALADHFEEVHGIDIAPSMIELANHHRGERGRVVYHLNTSQGLQLFEDELFDLVYSARTLQHIDPRYTKTYLREFLRILKPGGFLVFQLPAKRLVHGLGSTTQRQRLKRWLARLLPHPIVDLYRIIRYRQPWMEMHGIPLQETVTLLHGCGGRVLRIHTDESGEWLNARYIVSKVAVT
jgi:2-polyprenyl-3-methyl-5-hydroxy-6-metoxy-1,4-benzoquinol methylase